MLLFTFISIPAVYLLFIKKITYKNLFCAFIGVLTSSVLTLVFWALNTLYQPITSTLSTKFVKVLLGNAMPLVVLSVFYLVYHIKKINFINFDFSFKSGYLYWSLIFTIFSNTRRSSDPGTIILPVVYIAILLIHYYLDKIEFKKRDSLVKSVLYLLIPLLYILSTVFIYYSIIALSVFFVIVFVMSFTIKKKFKLLLSHFINLK